MDLVALTNCGPGSLVVRGVKWLWSKNKPLAVTAVVVIGAIKINNYIKKQKLRKKWDSAGKDVVILHMFPRGRFCPSLSPFVVKLEMFLRMADITYQVDYDEPLGSKGKCPWITLNGEDIADSQLIMERLEQQFGKDFSSHLSAEQRAVATTMRIMVEEHFLWILAYWRYVIVRGMPLLRGMELPFFVRFSIRRFAHTFNKAVWFQGIGRHNIIEIEEMGRKDLKVLSVYLGNKPYLMGEKATEVDCAVFGMLSQVVWNSPNSPYLKMLDTEFPNLHKYCQRVKERFWPDWNKCLYPPQ